jgi:hypothetical protein
MFAAAAASARETRLEWRAEGGLGEGSVRVVGLDSALVNGLATRLDGALGKRVLRVVARPGDARSDDADLPNLWGTWIVEEGDLAFRPRHAVAAGIVLDARFDGAAFDAAVGSTGTKSLTFRHQFAPAEGRPPAVVRIAPSGPTVPANLLRIYVEFSQPMSARDVESHVSLTADGRPVDLAFVDVRNGLWDPERKRLTLFVHPGRVKTGVAVQEEQGPVLRAGSQIVVLVRPGARDVDGRELAETHQKTWLVIEPRRQGLNAAQWRLEAPLTNDGVLVLRFPHPLDRALLGRAFTVLREATPVTGTWSVEDQEVAVTFRPESAWTAGDYTVAVDPALEDPTGQRLGRPFERDVSAAATATVAPVELRFTVPES